MFQTLTTRSRLLAFSCSTQDPDLIMLSRRQHIAYTKSHHYGISEGFFSRNPNRLRHPRNDFFFKSNKYIYRIKVSKNNICFNFEKSVTVWHAADETAVRSSARSIAPVLICSKLKNMFFAYINPDKVFNGNENN